MILQRHSYLESGIFGTLRSDDDEEICKTLEHSYASKNGHFVPKVPSGNYVCVRGVHRLHGGIPFETFEVTGVFGHSGILFHAGNYNRDSEGCILLGQGIVADYLVRSRKAFEDFLKLTDDADSFELIVV